MQTTQSAYTQPINATEIDGRTGDPIGGMVQTSTYHNSGVNGALIGGAATGVAAGSAAYGYANHASSHHTYGGASSNYYQGGGYNTTTVTTSHQPVYNNVSTHQTSAVAHQGPQVVNTTVNTGQEVIKGESRIEYVPFEKKITEYVEQPRVERVPRTVKVQEFREEVKYEEVPR